MALSFLFVATPILFFLLREIYVGIEKKELDLENGVRKWLTYALLFVVSAIMIGDLVTLFYNFLDGEQTIRFFLKALVIFVIAGTTFLHFFGDLREENLKKRKTFRVLWQWSFLIGVLLIFVGGILLVESPTTAKNRKIDSDTISNLSEVQASIESFYYEKKMLPSLPNELLNVPNVYLTEDTLKNLDGKGFTYQKTSKDEYRLCANFERSNKNDSKDYSYIMYSSDQNWEHDAGKICFERKIPERILEEQRDVIEKPVFLQQ